MKIREEILENLIADVSGTLDIALTTQVGIELRRAFEISLGMPVQQIKEMRERALWQENASKEARAEHSSDCSGAMAYAYKLSAEVFTGEEE